MGMYTQVKAVCNIKKEYCDIMLHPTIPLDGEWGNSEIKILQEFNKDGRAGFIKGKDCGNFVIFEGDLKNYDNTIEFFRDEVLPEICEDVMWLSIKNEEWITPEIYDFNDGNFVLIKQHVANW